MYCVKDETQRIPLTVSATNLKMIHLLCQGRTSKWSIYCVKFLPTVYWFKRNELCHENRLIISDPQNRWRYCKNWKYVVKLASTIIWKSQIYCSICDSRWPVSVQDNAFWHGKCAPIPSIGWFTPYKVVKPALMLPSTVTHGTIIYELRTSFLTFWLKQTQLWTLQRTNFVMLLQNS